MNEMNPNIPPSLRSALDEVYTVPQPDPAFAERLERQLHQRQIELMQSASPEQKPGSLLPTNRNSFMNKLRARPIMAAIAAILALLLLTGIAYAIGRLSGYIPGIGFVQDVQSVLETPVVVTREALRTPTVVRSEIAYTPQTIQTSTTEPISKSEPPLSSTALPVQEKKGITITVEQVVAETDRLVIAYKITGYPANFFGPERVPTLQAFAEAYPDDPIQEQVLLPDGTFLDHASGGHCEGGGDLATSWLDCQSIYAPLPSGVNQFTLQIHRLQNAIPDELPEDWTFPIYLIPVTDSQTANGIEEPALSSRSVDGITMQLLKVDRSSDQTAFQLGMQWEGQNRLLNNMPPITLHDDQGLSYPLTSGSEGDLWSPDHPNRIIFSSMVTNLADTRRPLTFKVDWAVMMVTDQAILHFNPGKDVELGQEWGMDQTVHYGGFDLHFIQARLKPGQDGSPTLEFDVQAPSEISGILLFVDGSLSSGGYFDQARGVRVSTVSLPALPTKPLDLTIERIYYQVDGPWEITWQP